MNVSYKNIKKRLLIAALFTASLTGMAQVGVGTTSPQAALDVVSTNSGMLFPRVANAAAVSSPKNGMIVYDLSLHCFNFHENDAWTGCLDPNIASNGVLAQIGSEADAPDAINSVVTVAQLESILPALSGVLADKEADYQNYIDAHPALFSNPATQEEVQAMLDAISATDVVDSNGNVWMDRNLGASQVATSSTDAAAYGDLYQWGRGRDGHEAHNSSTISTPSTGDAPGHGNFIIGASNWRSTANNALWQGVNGTNNPCPAEYRIPTEVEWDGLGITNAATAFSSPLKLTLAGGRGGSNGAIIYQGTSGYYWTSTVSGTNARNLNLNSTSASFNTLVRANGFVLRCIQD